MLACYILLEFIENLKRTSCKNCQQFFALNTENFPELPAFFVECIQNACFYRHQRKKCCLVKMNVCARVKDGHMEKQDICLERIYMNEASRYI